MPEINKPTPPDADKFQALQKKTDQQPTPVQHGEVIGIARLMKDRSRLSLYDSEDLRWHFQEVAPILDAFTGLAIPEGTAGCQLFIEVRNSVPNKVRVPLAQIPIPEFANVTESQWVDLAVFALKKLREIEGDQSEHLLSILAAIKNLETICNVIVIGDGGIRRREE